MAMYYRVRTRTKEVVNAIWIHVKDTQFSRLIDNDTRDDWSATNVLKTSGKNRFYFSSQQFKEMTFRKYELDAEIMNGVQALYPKVSV